jgi:hypothetical protein
MYAGRPGVRVSSRRFAQCVSFDLPSHLPEDDFFHLEPGGSRFIGLVPRRGATRAPHGNLRALNGTTSTPIGTAKEEGNGERR